MMTTALHCTALHACDALVPTCGPSFAALFWHHADKIVVVVLCGDVQCGDAGVCVR